MTPDDNQQLMDLALGLPTQERAALAARLISSLDEDLDDDAGELWEAEIERRLLEVESGAAVLIPWEQVRAEVFAPPDR